MDNEFDINKWNLNKYKLMRIYPQLTNADLIWRNETKKDLFLSISDKLGLTRKEFEEVVDNI